MSFLLFPLSLNSINKNPVQDKISIPSPQPLLASLVRISGLEPRTVETAFPLLKGKSSSRSHTHPLTTPSHTHAAHTRPPEQRQTPDIAGEKRDRQTRHIDTSSSPLALSRSPITPTENGQTYSKQEPHNPTPPLRPCPS
ncbi:hypothetical protein D8B26_004765 [Coccidioides posadasii str. Silveira]|uniref:uncharacterized protein n=1 Tax=Coccidioides posadasii (strain RMSCC 757 / Silveira) TaxID=443226 RepID=UPI001BF07B2A|nr:hypothetical protein D8B26_004765 [Coccidioides posadasii str. Silveira]